MSIRTMRVAVLLDYLKLQVLWLLCLYIGLTWLLPRLLAWGEPAPHVTAVAFGLDTSLAGLISLAAVLILPPVAAVALLRSYRRRRGGILLVIPLLAFPASVSAQSSVALQGGIAVGEVDYLQLALAARVPVTGALYATGAASLNASVGICSPGFPRFRRCSYDGFAAQLGAAVLPFRTRDWFAGATAGAGVWRRSTPPADPVNATWTLGVLGGYRLGRAVWVELAYARRWIHDEGYHEWFGEHPTSHGTTLGIGIEL